MNLPSSVQTQFNPQDGSETSTLGLTNVGSNHGGVYACSVSNERGSTGLHQATLTIIGQLLNTVANCLAIYIFLGTPHTVIAICCSDVAHISVVFFFTSFRNK